MSSESYVVSSATASDALSLVTTNHAAFADNRTTRLIYPEHLEHLTSRDEYIAWRAKRFRDAVASDDIVMKATPAGQPDLVAGFAQWHRPGHFAKKENQKSVMEGEDEQKKRDEPACVDQDVIRDFSAAIEQVRMEVWGDNHDYWYLGVLAVHPDFQGQGIASQLIQDGINRADEENRPLFLIASEKGAPVYLKRGFEPRAEPRQFRGQETYIAMVKSAKAKSVESTK